MNALLHTLRHPAILRLARTFLGLVLLAAALGKIGDPAAFAGQVENYRLLPLWSVNLTAIGLPWTELLAGLALTLGVRPRAGAIVALLCMAVFTVAVGSAWARGLDFECGCFGKASAATVGARKFTENAGLTLLAVIAALRARDAAAS